MPVFHFANDAGVGDFGTSELRDVIPLQDGMNKSIADMLVAGEFVAFPQRWVTGLEPTQADDGTEEWPFKPGADRLWTVAEQQAKFGQFDPADMTQYLKAQDGWDFKIARVSRTPVHWLTGEVSDLSGIALKTVEGQFVVKAHDRQHGWGPVMAEAVHLAKHMDGVTAERPPVPIWQPPDARSEAEKWDIAGAMIQAGVPPEVAWAEVGWEAEKIARAVDLATAQRQEAASLAGRVTSRGGE